MIAVVQRVQNASVDIDGKRYSEIGNGFLVLLGISESDTQKEVDFLCEKLSKLRIFEDENGKMNLSPSKLLEQGKTCQMLVVSQFTLCADCKGQNRPSFIHAAKPDVAIVLYESFTSQLGEKYGFTVKTGVFGADMKVNLLNDGPVTIILDTDRL